MLPDFPEQKRFVQRALLYFLQSRIIHHLGFFGQVPRVAIPEGGREQLVRSDGSSDDVEMKPARGDAHMPIDPNTGPTAEQVLKELDRVAEQLAREQFKIMFQKLEETAKRTGNVAALELDKFSLRDINNMLEKLEIPFDAKGNPRLPSIVVSPENCEKLMRRKNEVESDAEGIARHEEILARKKEEFLARESRRRLVD